nr:hypothetical protein Iba_chr15aCG16630 [Ipomoea batatas]
MTSPSGPSVNFSGSATVGSRIKTPKPLIPFTPGDLAAIFVPAILRSCRPTSLTATATATTPPALLRDGQRRRRRGPALLRDGDGDQPCSTSPPPRPTLLPQSATANNSAPPVRHRDCRLVRLRYCSSRLLHCVVCVLDFL